MQSSKVRIYAARADELLQEGRLEKAWQLCPPDRRKRAERFRLQSDRNLSLTAGLLLSYALLMEGVDPFPAVIRNTHGKPFFKELPYFFNLSHSQEWAVCAFGNLELGIDIECMKPDRPRMLRIAQKFFAEEENDVLSETATDEERTELFYRYWTMKAIGVGIYLAPGDGPIGLAEPEAAERKADGRELFFREFQEIPGYACSLCTIGKPDYVSFSIKDMDTVLRALSREV